MADAGNGQQTFRLALPNMAGVNINVSGERTEIQEIQNVLGRFTNIVPQAVERRNVPSASQAGPANNGPAGADSNDPRSQAESFVVQFGNPASGEGHSHEGQGHSHEGQRSEGQTHGEQEDPGSNGNSNTSILQTILGMVDKYIPFILLVFLKLVYNHRLGLLVLIGLYGTFYHANATLKRQIAAKMNGTSNGDGQSLVQQLWVLVFLGINVFFVYFVFHDQELYKCLIFQTPNIGTFDIWSLLWVVVITDFMIKYAAIAIKSLIALAPRRCLPYRKRGKFYMFTEQINQFYRCLTPVVPWVSFLLDDKHGGEWFSIVLLVIYGICKVILVWRKSRELREAFKKITLDVTYGSSPSKAETTAAGESCPICQDNYKDAVKLTCKHIFCEDCVSMWFDREQTCPMCRANIVDNPIYRDGSTAGYIQLY